jgi:uncharacterized membrane protein YhhN
VNAATVAAFVVAGLFATGDWIAKARSRTALEYLCKPATLVALIAAAALLDPGVDAHTRRVWFVAALICSLAGDVLLMLPQDLFVPGLAAFLVGHLCYLVGFWTHAPSLIAFSVSAVVVAGVVAPLGYRILTSIGTSIDRAAEPEALRLAVAGYVAVISVMLATALAIGNVAAAAGAVLFVASDSMIAWDRFVARFRWAPVAIMVTYHLGQAGLVASLLR